MKKIIIGLIAIGLLAGIIGASRATASGTNSNTNSGGGTVINASFSYIHCLYAPGGTAAACDKYRPKEVKEDPNPNDKTAG